MTEPERMARLEAMLKAMEREFARQDEANRPYGEIVTAAPLFDLSALLEAALGALSDEFDDDEAPKRIVPGSFRRQIFRMIGANASSPENIAGFASMAEFAAAVAAPGTIEVVVSGGGASGGGNAQATKTPESLPKTPENSGEDSAK